MFSQVMAPHYSRLQGFLAHSYEGSQLHKLHNLNSCRVGRPALFSVVCDSCNLTHIQIFNLILNIHEDMFLLFVEKLKSLHSKIMFHLMHRFSFFKVI